MSVFGKERPPQKRMGVLVNAAACVVIIAGLKAAAPVLSLLLLIAFLLIILTPLYYAMTHVRIPPWVAVWILIIGLTVSTCLGIALLGQSLIKLAAHLPEYQDSLREGVTTCSAWLSTHFKMNDTTTLLTLFDDFTSKKWGAQIAIAATGATQTLLAKGFIVLLITSFCIAELPNLPRIRQSRWMTEELWDCLVRVAADVRYYMGIKTLVSLATGLLIGIGMWAAGDISPFLMGLLAFILNYIPAIGSIVAAVVGILIALMRAGINSAIIVILIYLAVNMILSNILEPKFMGKGFGISPVLVLVSLVFWGFILGPVGMMLAVPITMSVGVVIGSLRGDTPPRGAPTPPSPQPDTQPDPRV